MNTGILELKEKYPVLNRISCGQETVWVNPNKRPAKDAIDECILTMEDNSFWLTVPGCMHHLDLDLGEEKMVCGLRMLPRQEGEDREALETHISVFSVLVSDDDRHWECVYTGEWKRSAEMKRCSFRPISARYIRLSAGPDWLLDCRNAVSSACRVWIDKVV